MLELYEYDAADTGGMIAVLDEAVNVRITKEINSTDRLTFSFPASSEKALLLAANRIISCEGQRYRIMRVSKTVSEIDVECLHIWFANAPAVHIPTISDNIGVTPYSLVRAASGGGFHAMSDTEVKSLGMSWIGKGDLLKNTGVSSGKEFAIDFFAVDKISLFDFVKTVIDNAGFGEIYYDNHKFAIVERIGKNTPLRLSLAQNLENISVETDISSMVTRLYPYGYEDLTIGSVHGKNYIDSPNISKYGIAEGYKDYSDYTRADDLFYNASWEFDELNPDRIDVPSVSITGTAIDLSRFAEYGDFDSIQLGDSVTVIDAEGTEISERVISISYYPYEAKPAELTIGRAQRDLYFYISQISRLASRYSKCSTTSGMISAKAISGTKPSSSVEISSSTAMVRGNEMISVIDGNSARVKIGIQDGKYVFKVYDSAGRLAIDTDSAQQGMIFAGKRLDTPLIRLEGDDGKSFSITADADGVYIDGKRIQTEN